MFMKENDYVQVRLDAWKTRIEVMEVKIKGISDDDYCEVLTRLFNNKRDNHRDILDLYNTYINNNITVVINLSNYHDGSYGTKEEDIDHLIKWIKSMCGYKDGIEVSYTIGKGYLWEVDEYRSNIKPFDENEEYQYNFIKGED